MFVHHFETRARRIIQTMTAFSVLMIAACGDSSDEARRAAALANDTTTLDAGAVRQPIPPGIDPAMVEWRSDGVLIASRDSLVKTPGYVVDSIFPPEEALRRFQTEAGGVPVASLTDGEPSVDALLRRYWRTLVRGDSLGLSPIVLNKAEFAYLYFPESDEPGNGMQPHVSWLLLSNNGGRGLARALERARGADSTVVGTVCSRDARVLGQNRFHGPCGIVRRGRTVTDTLWLTSHIIERNGTFKLMSFSNEL
jgi:hypothetical protein